MSYTLRHTFDVDPSAFWKMFFDAEYNRALFEGHLKFTVYKVLSFDEKPDGSIQRRVECAPPIEVPAVAKKVIGDNTSYLEEGRFDPRTSKFHVTVIPKMGGDKIKSSLTLWIEPRGPKKVERLAEIDTRVSVFGVGKVIEAFIEKQTRTTYDVAAAFTQQWIAQKGL